MKHLRINTNELPGPVAAPWGPKAIELLFIGALLATLTVLIFPNSAHAALIGMVAAPHSPDINTNGTFIDYVYTGGGSGGTLTIESYATDSKLVQDITLPIQPFWGTDVTGPGPYAIRDPAAEGTAAFGRTTYKLVANFDDAGVFTTGTVVVTGAIDAKTQPFLTPEVLDYIKPLDPTLGDATTNPCFQICSGWTPGPGHGPATLLTATLTGFGFKGEEVEIEDNSAAGGNDDGVCDLGETCFVKNDSLQMDWFMDMTGGDLYTAGFKMAGTQRLDVGVIAAGLVAWGNGVSPDGIGTFGPSWDPLDNNSTLAFLEDFRSCDPLPPGSGGGRCEVGLDTFVPIPAAVWLFGSGLLGLTGMGMRNRRRKQST